MNKISRKGFIKIAAAAAMSGVTAGALAACNSASGSASTSGAAGQYIPGTYEGTAEGISSTVKVTMTFSDSAVTDVVVDTSGETASFGAAAADELREQLLAAGSAEIDGVSGSTIKLSELYEGFDIPFEVFAGYEGEKKPDFNLNVPPSYHDCLLTFARDTFGADRVDLEGNRNNHLIIQPKGAEQDEPINISVIACELSDDGEFDNDRAKAAIVGLKPQSLKDYCRIDALLHGTDTWEGNGKELIEKGTCTLQQLICTREDIMNTLLEKGMNRRMAYEIMEHVRKGKANRVDSAKWQEMKVEMRKTGMPKWYIESCEKIKYLFQMK